MHPLLELPTSLSGSRHTPHGDRGAVLGVYFIDALSGLGVEGKAK